MLAKILEAAIALAQLYNLLLRKFLKSKQNLVSGWFCNLRDPVAKPGENSPPKYLADFLYSMYSIEQLGHHDFLFHQ